MTIIILLTIFLKIVLTIRVPTSWTDQIKQQSLQQLKPYGSHERHQNLNFQQDGWMPIQPPPHYYFPKPELTKFKKVHPLSEEHATKFAANPQENRPDRATNRKPDGYDLFEKNSNLFNRKRAQFRENPDLPGPKSGRFLDEDRDGEGLSTEFTPTRLYTQVRHFNDRQHLSRDEAEDPRLREVIRDSKIHTVYTEDGYEDSGYDHGGHEKNAEEDAGYVEFDKETETEGDNRDNSGDLEISSEIKLVKSPKSNGTETHKYVKIAPKSIDNKRKKRAINEKFPYYNRYGVNRDSPLRYSENFANIPDKQHDNLAFYHQADRIKCDEVESEVDPVPERIKTNDDGTVGDVGVELAKMPRLQQLGDKIDCFKLKYFGENPLDNPLFDEVTIAPVKSVFNQLSIQEEAVKSTVNDENLGTKILNDIVEQQRNGKDLVDDASPVSGALLGKRRRRLKPKRPYFIHRFPPTRTPFRTSTTPATISEVHYKTEIKPDEQFNVLNDVINNIKNSPKEPLPSGSNFVYLTSTTKPKHPNLDAGDSLQYENLELLKIGVVRSTKLPKITTTSTTEHQEIDEKFAVVGLSPPTPNRYKTINDKLDNAPINQFYFDGMKPPPIQQKFFIYHDFKTKMKQRQRYRRAAQRQNYSQVVRNRNKPIDIDDNEDDVVITSDDDDDYVPHRPKNYHYDEKLGRIVYDKTTQSTDNNEELEDIVEVLITEAPLPKPTRRTQLKFTNNPDEPSFLEFLKTVKSHSDYKQITEPPITEKSTTTTTIRTSSVESIPTRPAEFLGVLSKVRADPSYHKIDDKNETRQTTTTVIPEEITEEDVEEQVENVQNSRGSGVLTTGQNFQIFDINDYLPQIKNYSFRTSVDTTKYKTIERPSGRRKEDDDSVEEARESSEISTVMTTIKPPTTTTVRRLRNRPKFATTTTTTTTTERIESTTREKAKRVYPRRRVARIRLTTTTEENPTKIVHRRHQPETTPTPATTEANKNVTIFKDYDKAKRHGGNYRRQDDFGEKLTDVVPKPIMFYTDPTLPNNINRLVDTNPTISPIEDLTDHEYDDRTDEETEEIDNDDGKAKISKKTAFIKDPSQRLYYYAPI